MYLAARALVYWARFCSVHWYLNVRTLLVQSAPKVYLTFFEITGSAYTVGTARKVLEDFGVVMTDVWNSGILLKNS